MVLDVFVLLLLMACEANCYNMKMFPRPPFTQGPIVVPGSLVVCGPCSLLGFLGPIVIPWTHYGPQTPMRFMGPLVVPGPPCVPRASLCSQGPIVVSGTHCGPRPYYDFRALLWSPGPLVVRRALVMGAPVWCSCPL